MNNRYTVERIMEIIAFVINEQRAGEPLTKAAMDELHSKGYTESEISAALSWILERQSNTDNDDMVMSIPHPTSFRILHSIESDMVSSEAWGHILHYNALGFLSSEDVENILERAMLMATEQNVGLTEIKAIIAAYVMHQQPSYSNRTLLGGDEVIN